MSKKTNTTKAKTATKSTSKPAVPAKASDGQVLASVHVAAAVPPKGKPAAAVAAKAGKAPKAAKQSPTAAIRALLATDPAMEADAIAAALAKKGMQPPASTITTVRADFLGCYRSLVAAGKIKLN